MSDTIGVGTLVTGHLIQLRSRIGLAAVAVFCAATFDVGARESKDWIVLKNCRLISNPANDGDSFHASAGAREYIFRLYMVDAPETDEMTPRRLVEQAQYFAVPQAIDVGQAAKEFTGQKLSEPFTVFTRMSDAMGHSKLERFYAFVQTKDGDLGEQLVRNGLARNYGFKAVPPGLKNSRIEIEKLQKFEHKAKQEKIGGWGVRSDRANLGCYGAGRSLPEPPFIAIPCYQDCSMEFAQGLIQLAVNPIKDMRIGIWQGFLRHRLCSRR